MLTSAFKTKFSSGVSFWLYFSCLAGHTLKFEFESEENLPKLLKQFFIVFGTTLS